MSSNFEMIIKMKVTEWYAKGLWPVHRLFLKNQLKKRCKKCAMSEAATPLNPTNGLCSVCSNDHQTGNVQDFKETAQKEEPFLHQTLLDAEKKSRSKYDALVLYSGGKDSIFLISELKKKYPKLKLLAFLVDNGYMSPVALENAKQAAEKLDVDYMLFQPAKSFYKKYFSEICVAPDFKKRGCFETVDMIEIYFFYCIAKNFAADQHIPFIIDGLAWAQVVRLADKPSFEWSADYELQLIEKDLGSFIYALKTPESARFFWNAKEHSTEKIPRLIHPFFIWRYEENFIRSTVVKMGLLKQGHDSPLLTNQQVLVLMVIADYARIGYCSYEPDICMQIRAGTASRRYWQSIFEMSEYISQTGWMMKKDLKKIAADLGVSTQDIGLSW